MDIQEIYKKADSLLIQELMIEDFSMRVTQSWGLNGFKRLHRHLEKWFNCKHIDLETSMFDRYRVVLNASVPTTTYNPSNLKTHIENYEQRIKTILNELATLNFEHFKIVGVDNEVISETIHKLNKIYEKISRYHNKFDKENWNWDTIFYEDNLLHSKMKESYDD